MKGMKLSRNAHSKPVRHAGLTRQLELSVEGGVGLDGVTLGPPATNCSPRRSPGRSPDRPALALRAENWPPSCPPVKIFPIRKYFISKNISAENSLVYGLAGSQENTWIGGHDRWSEALQR